ncbi:hypothetical protein DFH09DRAFT_1070610 [Mycena vulgaris]|nr:hypothetical protein DFH09DRAFT_1070610 [Mycena vulgaris]
MPSSEAQSLAGNDRLIDALQLCFLDLLKKQEEQSDRAARLYTAVEALKPKAPATDEKTNFWNLYKSLADEHDKEFQQRHSTDLDASLIFAGLFSAVDSAFIIQIQQEIKPVNTPLIPIIAQSLLYISLGSTLLAALLAVLGKQWLMYYSAAGERGTIGARGLERQRKLDGLRRWKFDTVMQIFPLLLQLGLLLFAAALSVYLWTIHVSLAIIVISVTSFGVITYTALLISAALSPDSPFQTPLVPLVARLFPTTLWMHLRRFFGRLVALAHRCIQRTSSVWSYIWWPLTLLRRCLARRSPRIKPGEYDSESFRLPSTRWGKWPLSLLRPFLARRSPRIKPGEYDSESSRLPPTRWEKSKRTLAGIMMLPLRFVGHIYSRCSSYVASHFQRRERLAQPTESTMRPLPEPSPEVPAVSWVLETSTDPVVIAAAAEIAVNLQWPMRVDLTPQISRLRDAVLGCFEYQGVYKITDDGPVKGINLDKIRNGMGSSAIRCGQAYGLLRAYLGTISSSSKSEEDMIYCVDYRTFEPAQLRNVVRILAGSSKLAVDTTSPVTTTWALRVIPSLVPYNRPTRKLELEYFLDQFQETLPQLNVSTFTDYLFCLNTFLAEANPLDVARADKSLFQEQLLKSLFERLRSNLMTGGISMDTAVKIVDTTGRLASKNKNKVWLHGFRDQDRQSIIYPFCSSLVPQSRKSRSLVWATTLLTGSHNYWPRPMKPDTDPSWIYTALESINVPTEDQEQWDDRTVTGVAGLLQALLYYDAYPAPATTVFSYVDQAHSRTRKNIPLLLRALSIPGDISRIAAHLLVRDKVFSLFQHTELRAILQEASVWSSLARVSFELEDHFQFSRQFIHMGQALAGIPAWHSHIHGDLCAWITTFFRGDNIAESLWGLAEEYNSVLSRVWNIDTYGYKAADNGEKALALSFVALQKIWNEFDFTGSGSLDEAERWFRCTSIVVYSRRYCRQDNEWVEISPKFQTMFPVLLATSLMRAAERARTAPGGSSSGSENVLERKEALDRITSTLEELSGNILDGREEGEDFRRRGLRRAGNSLDLSELVWEKPRETRNQSACGVQKMWRALFFAVGLLVRSH